MWLFEIDFGLDVFVFRRTMHVPCFFLDMILSVPLPGFPVLIEDDMARIVVNVER